METSAPDKQELIPTSEPETVPPKAGKGKKKKNLCFIISPFGGWFDRYFDEIYQPAAEDAGLVARRADDLYRPSAIVNDIWTLVKEAKLLLADLSDKNPNVFYELGLAHAIGKPVVLLTRSMEDVPFDLRSLRVIEYDVQDPEWSDLLRESITKAIQEVLEAPQSSVLPTFLSSGLHSNARVKSSSLEKRLQSLEMTISRIALRDRSSYQYRREHVTSEDAREYIRDHVKAGAPTSYIIERLEERGVPRSWTFRQINDLRRSSTRTAPKKKKAKSRKH